MVHSIELLFDTDTEAEICRQWAALAAAGLPSAAHNPSPTNRPHVTLAVAEHIHPDADTALRSLAGLPLDCRVGSVMLFGSRMPTLVRLIVPTAGLLALNRAVDAACQRHAEPDLMPNCRPDRWTPHVTLCRKLAPADVGTALAAVGGREVTGSFAAMRHWLGDVKQTVELQPSASN